MMDQWIDAAHRFEVNEHNFEIKTMKDLQQLFLSNFESKSFNRVPWPRWTSRYAQWVYENSHSGHTMLDETGTLKRSIKTDVPPIGKNNMRGMRRSKMYTDPSAFGTAKRHPGFCYAEVHNNLNSLISKPYPGPKFRRQFMGHSNATLSILRSNERMIFQGFPHKYTKK